jgi:16S rRNA (guanine966-N2)-methyltransferase
VEAKSKGLAKKHSMRIVGGQMSGRRLVAPKGDRTRPSSDATKESLFNILDHRFSWPMRSVADLFCGSGALGLECLSRGAERAYFLDNAPAAIAALKSNIDALALTGVVQFKLSKGAQKFGSELVTLGAKSLDTVLSDPPYHQRLAAPAFKSLSAQSGLLAPDCLWVQELGADEEFKGDLWFEAGFKLEVERGLGATKLVFLKRTA